MDQTFRRMGPAEEPDRGRFRAGLLPRAGGIEDGHFAQDAQWSVELAAVADDQDGQELSGLTYRFMTSRTSPGVTL